MTEWENHRTQTEWEDSLIIKSFAFQFVNNYFTLFYIGILRQSTKSDKCMDPSCMDPGIHRHFTHSYNQLHESLDPWLHVSPEPCVHGARDPRIADAGTHGSDPWI